LFDEETLATVTSLETPMTQPNLPEHHTKTSTDEPPHLPDDHIAPVISMSTVRDRQRQQQYHPDYPLDYEDPIEDFLHLESEIILLLVLEYLTLKTTFLDWIKSSQDLESPF
jgi:hypothetical protein